MDKLLRSWFDASRRGVAFVVPTCPDKDGNTGFCYQLVNTSLASLLNQTPDSLIGQPVRGLLLPEREANFTHQLLTVSRTGDEQTLEEPLQRAGEHSWLHITLTRLDEAVQISVEVVDRQNHRDSKHHTRRTIDSFVSTLSDWFLSANADELDTHVVHALGELGCYNQADGVAIVSYAGAEQPGCRMYEWRANSPEPRKNDLSHLSHHEFNWLNHRLTNEIPLCLTVDDLPPEAIQEKRLFESASAQSMLAVPLIRDAHLTGFVGFFTETQSKKWPKIDASLLQTFGTLVVNLTFHVQHQLGVTRLNQYLTGLHALDQTLLSRYSTDHSPLAIILKHINALVPCDRLRVFRIDEAARRVIADCQIVNGVSEEEAMVIDAPDSCYSYLLKNSHGIYLPVLEAEMTDVPLAQELYQQGVRSLLIIPLFRRQRCLGAFTLASYSPDYFTEEHFQIARKSATHLGLTLYQRYLNNKQKQHTEQLEQWVEERTQEIGHLSTLHQAILKHAGQAILSTDIHGIIQTSNPACENLLGYGPNELIGLVFRIDAGLPDKPTPIISYSAPGSTSLSINNVALAVASKRYFYEECVAIGKDGRNAPMLLTINALQDEAGTTIGYIGIATDIAALKMAEQKFQQKNQELDTFFNGALDMHCISDAHGNLSKVNQAFQSVLGYSEAELIAIPFLYLLHPEEQKYVYQQLLAVILQQPVENQINQFRKKDGTYRIIEWNAIAIDNVVYGSARDITERQQAETQLRNLNQRLQLATQASGQGIWENDLKQDTLLWDDRMWEMYGMRPGRPDWRFENFIKMIHPDDLPGFMKRYQEHLGSEVLSNVCRIIQPSGAIRYIEANGLITRDEQGHPNRAIGVAWDVTERKLAEESLRESEQRFREITENVDEVFWIHSATPFRLLYVNAAYERVWNVSRQSLRDNPRSFLKAVVADDRPAFLAFLRQYRAGIEGQLYCRLHGPARSIRWLSIRTFIIRNEAGAVTRHIGIANNITSQKEQELILQQSLHREQELNQLKSQFVATASHEFRTPLATIQSSVDLIKLYLNLNTASARQSIHNHLAVIEREIEKFGDLLSDMLTIGKIEAGKVVFRPHWGNAVAVCESVAAIHFSSRTDGRSVILGVEGTPRPVWIDEKLMSHVIVNLLSNAFKFSRESPRLHLLFTDNGLRIDVIDTGIGIPEKDLCTLFQAFSRASNTAGIPGTGLGLVIARQFVDLHDGQLTIQSKENKGTTFTITLPAGVGSQVQPFHNP
ncbi:PAS domain S-box protein [Spirosoma utsteinense]|uniref:PAS domain S-box protein n=1 Tax=Spirosoma utsteinense TaxID=2585773 RepID=UPI0016493B28|nr:PAS domain S-box protein [Spirosoma utsteinense]MBC3788510.1 PAS domain S-box-containing protein [Spirosoma utsteinense]